MLCEYSQQQGDSQLRAQALQQLQEAGTTAGNAGVEGGSPGDPGDFPRYWIQPPPVPTCIDLNNCTHLPGTYYILCHQRSPPSNLDTYLRGRGEDTG